SSSVDGRMVIIGLLGGGRVENFNLNQILAKRIEITGTLLNLRRDQYKSGVVKDLVNNALNLFKSNDIRPIIDSNSKLAEFSKAHDHMQASKNIDNIILTI